MDNPRLLDILADEVRRLRVLAGGDLDVPVPTCPGWTVRDLVEHVARGFRTVVGKEADPVDPTPVEALDQAYGAATSAFVERPDRFWIRRMAQEAAIHRFDAELALGTPITPFPEDFAVDAIGEMLDVFLRRETHTWPQDYAADLTEWDGHWMRIDGWRVSVHPLGVDVAPAGPEPAVSDDAAATVRGAPGSVLLWLYNRGGDVSVSGDLQRIAQVKRLLTTAMNAT
ncbi:maleylpyruvate isomerase N-terminal domain-containing protein [Umezawaea sp. Da 62-37]|uniref:maleylpyruvate isomerase N-terminal domain-containing protein n=1 Tax=Umezawaea sp. Da 62-37 TaxID=3075927 RepID=UPI0028F72444|nr:maleylpyruvate isomerase N-terminal domain-containing protein [Umezawaea sp. Da 62-37]WNV90490.1 maleylpyruvate isomerase N-terminal domain-containing protein [Umezawaea sp. Da 62-37]